MDVPLVMCLATPLGVLPEVRQGISLKMVLDVPIKNITRFSQGISAGQFIQKFFLEFLHELCCYNVVI